MVRSINMWMLLALLLIDSRWISAQPAKPFPQHIEYMKGSIFPSNVSQIERDARTSRFYEQWKQRYLRAAADSQQYYIWINGAVGDKRCVSEGQGYGMIITVLMAGCDTESRLIYDGLFRFCRAHQSDRKNYLMAWAQGDNLQNMDGTSASDGDLDIAYSLLLADVQWGSKGNINYLQEARQMITAIKNNEINSQTHTVLLSDAVDSESKDYYDMRTSDFMPDHFKTFDQVMGDRSWLIITDANYKLFRSLQLQYSPDAGLFPDFILHVNKKPGPPHAYYLESNYDGFFNYNACRVPWRIATDYLISGDSRSKAIVDKINDWIQTTSEMNPDNISAGYKLNGDDIKTSNFEAMSFIGSFAVAAMVDGRNQSWLNKLWDYMNSFGIDQFDYYDNTLEMIDLLLLSGNYWDPGQQQPKR